MSKIQIIQEVFKEREENEKEGKASLDSVKVHASTVRERLLKKKNRIKYKDKKY